MTVPIMFNDLADLGDRLTNVATALGPIQYGLLMAAYVTLERVAADDDHITPEAADAVLDAVQHLQTMCHELGIPSHPLERDHFAHTLFELPRAERVKVGGAAREDAADAAEGVAVAVPTDDWPSALAALRALVPRVPEESADVLRYVCGFILTEHPEASAPHGHSRVTTAES